MAMLASRCGWLDGRILAPEADDEPQSQPQREASVAIEAR